VEETFRIVLDQLLREEELDNLAPFMAPSLFAEAPLYSQDAQVSFLDGLPVRERNTVLIRFAVKHLKTLILYRAEHFAASDDDFVAMVSIMGWEHHDPDVDLLVPYLWSANPSRLELTGALLTPATTACSAFVAQALGNDPAYAIHEGYHSGHPPYLDRVYVRPVTMPLPPNWLTGGAFPR
jgi:hypothetical protein